MTPPVITLNGVNPVSIPQGSVYTDAGATAVDAVDGVVTVTTSGTVNTSAVGSYTISYTAMDASGNTVNATRTVNVTAVVTLDLTPPVITLNGVNPVSIPQGAVYTDAGATAMDAVDGAVAVTTSGVVDAATLGSYDIAYTATDAAGNTATATRTVNITAVNIPGVPDNPTTPEDTAESETTGNNLKSSGGGSFVLLLPIALLVLRRKRRSHWLH